jgi:hypothetical protein
LRTSTRSSLYVSFDFADAIEEWVHQTRTAYFLQNIGLQKAARTPAIPPAESPLGRLEEPPCARNCSVALQARSIKLLKSKRVSNERRGREKLKHRAGSIKMLRRPLRQLFCHVTIFFVLSHPSSTAETFLSE